MAAMRNTKHTLPEDTTQTLTQSIDVAPTSRASISKDVVSVVSSAVSAVESIGNIINKKIKNTINKKINKTWQGFYYFTGFYFSQ